MGAAVRRRHAYLAGDDQARRADLQRMLDDPDVRAIFCARGGYGSQRLLPGLDLTALVEHPKPIVGYSDVTALLTAAVGAGAVAVHGPMVAADIARGLSRRSADQLRSVLTDASHLWEAEVPLTVRPGAATGRLMGGNLSVLVATLGTPWAPDTDGAILFLEDVREPPYRVDRLLTQLAQAGKLDRVAGVVFGTFAGCEPAGGADVLDVVRACCGDLPCPVGVGLPAGHDTGGIGCENLALPFGISVVLDTERACLTALEPAVC
jgi:muramoyltetrapeptide carboxypeptidase